MRAIKKFKVNTKELTDKEREVLEKLITASELMAPLYEEQKNPKYKGANFYPKDATKEEIKEAAEKNPLILHPYTFVERDRRGRLVAIPFSVKFKRELKQIAKLLGEAAKISEDRDFGQYLKDLARALLRNDYAQNEILWVTRGPFKFNFIIGPIERYLDRLFFKKCAFQAWVGILDKQRTDEAERFKRIILASRRKVLPDTMKVELPQRRIEINKTVCFSGLIADTMFTGTNLPNSVDLMEKYGSKLTIFESPLELNFQRKGLPIFKSIFNKNIQEYFSENELWLASLRCILLHEISHSLIRYRDAEERLGELFPIFDELLAYILGIRYCGLLLLKGALSQKELEAIITAFLWRNFSLFLERNSGLMDYAVGGAIAQNFFFKNTTIKEKNGILYLNFTKLFIAIDHLSRILEYYLSSGSYEEAKNFVREYGSFAIFERFSSKLKEISR